MQFHSRRSFTGLLGAAVLVLLPRSAVAEDVDGHNGPEEFFAGKALTWSRENPHGIAIAISLSIQSLLTADVLGEQISVGFEQLHGANVETAIFSRKTDSNGDLVTFFVAGAPFGPYQLEQAAAQMTNIIVQYRAVQDV